jgi:molybdenum cofactor synthesis domain-containing protein
MLSLLEAQRIVAALPLPALELEDVPLEAASGRILARAPEGDSDLPPFDRVTMDGFAVRAADLGSGASLLVAGELAAGATARRPLAAGEALRIMTGAPLPAGADAVVPIEDARVEGDRVALPRSIKPGQNVHRRGVDLRRGDRPLPAGTRITAARVPLLATLGCRKVAVTRRPRVALLATGSELVEPERAPSGGQIRESNRFALAAQSASAACEPAILPLVVDDRAAIRTAVQSALQGPRAADVLLVTGGSSVGDFDFSKVVLVGLGAKPWFEQVRIKPGKPVLLFTIGERVVFCLPGNPVSAFVTFEVLVRPLLDRLSGAGACWPVPDELPLSAPLSAPPERDLLQVARIAADPPGRTRAEPIRWSGSGDLVSIARANALIHLRQGASEAAGALVRVTALRSAWDDLPRASEPIA